VFNARYLRRHHLKARGFRCRLLTDLTEIRAERKPYSAASMAAVAGSTRAAQNLNSGIFP